MACCLTAPSHYLNHVDLILVRSHGIHLRALSLVDVKIQINKTRLKIAVLKWHLGTPGTNELTPVLQQGHCSTGDDNAFYATHTVTAWRQTPRKLMPSESWILLKHTWWRHQMETFSALLVLCAGNSPVPVEFSAQRPVTRSFDVFLDLRMNKRLSKQPWGWWFETPSWLLWRHCNELAILKNQLVTLKAEFLWC